MLTVFFLIAYIYLISLILFGTNLTSYYSTNLLTRKIEYLACDHLMALELFTIQKLLEILECPPWHPMDALGVAKETNWSIAREI